MAMRQLSAVYALAALPLLLVACGKAPPPAPPTKAEANAKAVATARLLPIAERTMTDVLIANEWGCVDPMGGPTLYRFRADGTYTARRANGVRNGRFESNSNQSNHLILRPDGAPATVHLPVTVEPGVMLFEETTSGHRMRCLRRVTPEVAVLAAVVGLPAPAPYAISDSTTKGVLARIAGAWRCEGTLGNVDLTPDGAYTNGTNKGGFVLWRRGPQLGMDWLVDLASSGLFTRVEGVRLDVELASETMPSTVRMQPTGRGWQTCTRAKGTS